MTDNDKSKQKIITLTNNGGPRWSAEFEGRITRRDIVKLNRIISVEYAKFERRRSVTRLRGKPVENSPVEVPTNVNENPDHQRGATDGERNES